MEQQNFQTAELRDENNNIVQEGAYGRKTPLTTGDNQGWIDFVMNNLEWLKANNVDVTVFEQLRALAEENTQAIGTLDGEVLKTSDIATQAQAEAGTDNTTVMTPLRAAQEINSKRPIKTYTAFEQFGCTAESDISDIYSQLPENSIFYIGGNVRYSWGVDINGGYVLESSAGRLNLRFFAVADGVSITYQRTYTSWWDTGWHKLATNGALSMPSSSGISIDLGQATYAGYSAPSDGWFMVSATLINDGLFAIEVYCEATQLRMSVISSTQAGQRQSVYLPVAKGMYVTSYIYNMQRESCYFFYAQSEV